MNHYRQLRGSLDERTARTAFLGHMLMAAPHPMVMCVGSLIAGLSWFSVSARLKRSVGSLLIAFGSLMAIIISGLWFIHPGEVLQRYVVSGSSLLVLLMLMLSFVLYGLLSIALFDLSKRHEESMFKLSAAFLAIAAATTLSLGLLTLLSLAWSHVSSLLELREVLAFFEGSAILFVASNSLGNILAGVGFVRRRAKLISAVLKKGSAGEARER